MPLCFCELSPSKGISIGEPVVLGAKHLFNDIAHATFAAHLRTDIEAYFAHFRCSIGRADGTTYAP